MVFTCFGINGKRMSIGSKFRVIWPSVLIIQRGVATTPLRKICLGKTLRRTRVKTWIFFFFSILGILTYQFCFSHIFGIENGIKNDFLFQMILDSCKIHLQQNHNLVPWRHQPHLLVLRHNIMSSKPNGIYMHVIFS